MKITKKWLKRWNACQKGIDWWVEQKEIDTIKILRLLINQKHFDWFNWTITKVLNRKQRIRYAVYAAQQVLSIFEKKHPKDKRPRKAIEAAIKCIDNNIKENRNDASAASAAYAVYAAYDASATYAANDAYDAYTASAAKQKIQIKILNYGIKLLKGV